LLVKIVVALTITF